MASTLGCQFRHEGAKAQSNPVGQKRVFRNHPGEGAPIHLADEDMLEGEASSPCSIKDFDP